MARKKSHYKILRQKWLARHKLVRENLHKKHKEALDFLVEKLPAKEQLASGAAGALMLSSVLPTTTLIGAMLPQTQTEAIIEVDRKRELLDKLSPLVGEKARILTSEEEMQLSQILSHYYNMEVTPAIDGKRLNRTYGVIGAEQHLVRFPGDSMQSHLDLNDRGNKMIYSSGMAGGRGAWGYFAKSRSEFTQKDVEREKWYIAVQTFAALNYNERLPDYRDFFKWRKMLVVNPATGQAIVCDIADSGPAIWTGKHLGGSPEVMYNLGFGQGSRKGPVLYFFINDLDDKIPLGPLEVSLNK